MATQRKPGTDAGGEIVYEVEAALDPAVVADFDAWLPGHAREVLASPGFLGAEILAAAEPAADGRAACGNCGAALAGAYCAACGQHAHESARALKTLLHDAWHVFTHVDDRFWSTLRTLLARPGLLTREYFAERRASYLPPFRLYLVLSLVFFGLSSLTGVVSVNAQGATAGPAGAPAGDPLHAALSEAAREVKADAERDGVALPAAAARVGASEDAALLGANNCDAVAFFGWHAARSLPLLEPVAAASGAAPAIYAAWYGYRSMRVYYGQRRSVTLVKLGLVSFAYLLCLAMTLTGTLLVSALTA